MGLLSQGLASKWRFRVWSLGLRVTLSKWSLVILVLLPVMFLALKWSLALLLLLLVMSGAEEGLGEEMRQSFAVWRFSGSGFGLFRASEGLTKW